MDKQKCDCYEIKKAFVYRYETILRRVIARKIAVGVCHGTRECEPCKCGGDRKKCDFYEEVRNG